MDRLAVIEQRMRGAFSPSHLEVIDDSHKHVGHAGAEGGAGHYTVVIASDCFNGLPRVSVHKQIYAALTDLIPHEIHALQIRVR